MHRPPWSVAVVKNTGPARQFSPVLTCCCRRHLFSGAVVGLARSFAPSDPNFECLSCATCPSGQFLVTPCTKTSQTVCKKCTTCSSAAGLIAGGGCVGEQDTACVGFISHDPLPELAANISAAIVFRASFVPHADGANNTVTLRPVSDDGAVKFTPESITVSGNKGVTRNIPLVFDVVPTRAGRLAVRYEITGAVQCRCRPQPAGAKCRAGCPGGSGFLPLEPETLLIFNPSHRSVFERLGIALGTLPTGTYERDVVACPGGNPSFSLLSTDRWQAGADNKHEFSCGVIHGNVKAGKLDIKVPMSVSGGVANIDRKFHTFGPATSDQCGKVPLFEEDALDYLSTGALGKSLFEALGVPNWINLQDAGIPVASYSNKDLAVSMVDGADLPGVRGCAGLPAKAGTTYTLLQYQRSLKFTLQGVSVVLTPETTKQVCIVLDMCTQGGCSGKGGVAFMLGIPEDMWKELYVLPVFQQLAQKGLAIQGARMGLGGEYEPFGGESPQFWNGDETFVHSDAVNMKSNFFVGGAVTQSLGNTVKVRFDSNVFMTIPGLCGDSWRDAFGAGPWSAAAQGDVELQTSLLGGSLTFAVTKANIFMSLGGDQQRKVCTDYGSGNVATNTAGTANPSGVFFSGNLKTPNLFGSSILAKFLPSMEANVDAYLLANHDDGAVAGSKVLGAQIQEDLKGVLETINAVKDKLVSALSGNKLAAIMGALADLRSQLGCAGSGAILCWSTNPLFKKAAEFLQSILDTATAAGLTIPTSTLASKKALQAAERIGTFAAAGQRKGGDVGPPTVASPPTSAGAANKVIGILKAKVAAITSSFESAAEVIANNLVAAAEQPLTEITDLSAGFGVRGRVRLDLGYALRFAVKETSRAITGVPLNLDYVGVAGEVTYSTADALKQCDKFNFVYEDLFEGSFKGDTAVVAKTQLVSASGGLTSQSASTAGAVFDGDLSTAWNSGGLAKSPTFGTKSGIVFRAWSITTVHAVHVYSDGCNVAACAAQISLAVLENDQWRTIPLKGGGDLARDKGWHTAVFESALPVSQWTVWRVLVEKQHIAGAVSAVPSASGAYPAVNELRLVGTGPRHAVAAELSLSAQGSIGDGVWSVVKIRARTYMQLVLGLESAELATTGTFESVTKSSPDGNFLLRMGIESSILGITRDTTAIYTVHFTTADGRITGFTGGTMTFATAGDIWGLFRVRLAITLYLLQNRVGFQVRGIFENSLQDKAVRVVHSFFTRVKDETNKRFDAAKNEVSRWQSQINGAKSTLYTATEKLSSVQREMAKGKDALDAAKRKLEDAKGPFKKADDALRKAQANVDSVCGMRSCKWYKPWNCVWNAGCWILRQVVYAALAVARFVMRVPMMVLDLCKLVLDAAKVVVDIGIRVVDVAKIAVEAAKYAMDGIVGLLEVAKTALDFVKRAVAFGLDVVNALVKFVIGELFNIRRASFDVEVSTKHPFKFKIMFDLTVLGVRMDNVGVDFDFSSASAAFESLVNTLIGFVKKALGLRRRRDIIDVLDRAPREAVWQQRLQAARDHFEEGLGRFARASNANGSAATLNNTTESDTAAPAEPTCSCFGNVVTFLQDSFDALVHVQAHEDNLLDTKQRAQETNASYHAHLTDFDLSKMAISDDALKKNAITREQLQEALTKDAMRQSTLVVTLSDAFSAQALQIVDMVDNDAGWLHGWRVGVQNVTLDCGGQVRCHGFADCAQAGLTYLANELELRQRSVCLANTSRLHREQTGCSQYTPETAASESELLERVNEASQTFADIVDGKTRSIKAAVAQFANALTEIQASERKGALFCGVAPSIYTHPSAAVRSTGGNLELFCSASGLPTPTVSWTRDGKTLMGKHDQTLSLIELTPADAGHYACVASNSKGVAKSRQAAVKVYSPTDFELAVELEITGAETLSNDQLGHAVAGSMGVAFNRIEGISSSAGTARTATTVTFSVLPYDLDEELASSPNATSPTFPDGQGNSNTMVHQKISKLACNLHFKPLRVMVSNSSHFDIRSAQVTFVYRTTVAENMAAGSLVQTLADPLAGTYPGNATYSVSVVDASSQDAAAFFEVNPHSGDVTVRGTLDREVEGSHALRATVVHEAVFASGTTTCSRVSAMKWARSESDVANECLSLSMDAIEQLQAGGLQCGALSDVLGAVAKRCFHQDAQVYILQVACMEQCAPDGYTCGASSRQYCPFAPEIRTIGSTATQAQKSCVGEDLATRGVCVVPNALACDGLAMSRLRDAVNGGDHTCTTWDDYYQETHRCTGAMRVDEPLFNVVRVNCTAACPGMCKLCTGTNASVVAASLLAAITENTEAGCNERARFLSELDSCVARDMINGPIDVEMIKTLHAKQCGDIPTKTLYADATRTELAEYAEAVAAVGMQSRSCNDTTIRMIQSMQFCNGLPNLPSVNTLRRVCHETCGTSRCAELSTHDIILQVRVGNTNDNTPVFDKSLYSVVVSEADEFMAGEMLGVVAATDADNDRVTYKITQYRKHKCSHRDDRLCAAPWESPHDVWETIDSADAPVEVDRLSGVLTRNAPLDYEAVDLIELTVSAFDHGDKHFDTCMFSIVIADTNDNMPALAINGPGTVEENLKPGTIVMPAVGSDPLLVADDADASDRGNLRFRIRETSGATSLPFRVDTTLGSANVVTTEYLNHEVKKVYLVVIEATDTAGHTVEKPLTIKVTDADEFGFFAPSETTTMVPTETDILTDNPVDKQIFRVTINEANATGEFVLFKASAGHRVGHGSTARFAIVQAEDDLPFGVDRNGWIVANGTFDYESKREYTFNIIATSDSGQQAEASVHVVVTDANDNAPTFAPYSGVLHIANCNESLGEDSNELAVMKESLADMGVNATDADAGANAALSFHLISAAMSFDTQKAGADTGPQPQPALGGVPLDDSYVFESLRLSPTGRLCAVNRLPMCGLYELRIEARDGGQPQLASQPVAFQARRLGSDEVCGARSGSPEQDSPAEGSTSNSVGASFSPNLSPASSSSCFKFHAFPKPLLLY